MGLSTRAMKRVGNEGPLPIGGVVVLDGHFRLGKYDYHTSRVKRTPLADRVSLAEALEHVQTMKRFLLAKYLKTYITYTTRSHP